MTEDDVGDEPAQLENAEDGIGNHEKSVRAPEEERIVELLAEEMAGAPMSSSNGFSGMDYRNLQGHDEASEDGSVDQATPRVESPSGSLLSNPDGSPSVQVVRRFF